MTVNIMNWKTQAVLLMVDMPRSVKTLNSNPVFKDSL